jgi:hypothetical protein
MVVCAGYVLAMKNLWIAMAKLMYCFDVELAEVYHPLLPTLMLGFEGGKIRPIHYRVYVIGSQYRSIPRTHHT